VAIVTGASAGIGRSIAIKLVKAGMKVVGVARRTVKMEIDARELEKESGTLYVRKCDMTSEDDIKATFQWAMETLGPVHILINSAGGNPGTDFIDGNAEKWRSCFNLNVVGLSIASREATRIMLDNSIDGHIVNLNSVLGHLNFYMPESTMYSASKHAVGSITELMRQELQNNPKKSNIKITSISPGAVRTEFINDDIRDNFGPVTEHISFLDAEDVSDAVMYVLGTPPRVHIRELIIMAQD